MHSKNCESLNPELSISWRPENFYKFNFGDTISDSCVWSNIYTLDRIGPSLCGSGGRWRDNGNEGYLGLKFTSNNESNYGWIKVLVGFRCFGYAVSQTKGAVITVGQKE